MVTVLIASITVSAFVGINIGGSSTGVAFGPALGANAITRLGAAVLMSLSALVGGWTVGRNVVTTMSYDIVASSQFSLGAGLVVLGCIGVVVLGANLLAVPASTSMIAVGAMVGMGIGSPGVNWELLVRITAWWLLAPAVGFAVAAAVGRWIYADLVDRVGLDDPVTPPVTLSWNGLRPRIDSPADTTRSDRLSTLGLLAIACYMGFSAGASNVANAIAPLVGSGTLPLNLGVLVAVGAISVGAFTVARRTMATVASGLTSLSLTAACIVALIGATITAVLSYLGIPASLALSTIAAIIGLGWGRARRGRIRPTPSPPATRAETVRYDSPPSYAVHPAAVTLFHGSTAGRVLAVWSTAPVAAGAIAFLASAYLL
ncbi:inorganic phosphate transporter [Halopiger xanaduensis]|uniref:Phosphate transporter n=1 Tax=Halopiger xanaduensis (strain DSM 18323 / JCM 14033 / SH-6) TaxID=797210 RepID=F8DD60_HALXS|nr:inorganic phosphate transporter [Halopiger xanaduensis]AEH38947.1 phosphate transporter [Halopiger xanaduensis SH-6]